MKPLRCLLGRHEQPVSEDQSKSLHNALIASFDAFEQPVDSNADVVERIARGLRAGERHIIRRQGLAYGTAPFYANIMRPLERKGLFSRITQNGFQTRWELTALGSRVRAHLEDQHNDR